MDDTSALYEKLRRDGYVIVPDVYSPAQCQQYCASLASLVQSSANYTLRRRGDAVYAIRHLVDLWPTAATLWRVPPLLQVLTAMLGNDCGLVRTILFDKPPNQTWAVPWHQDLTIAIQPPAILSKRYSRPRLKSDVWHCEPPIEVLEQMLTLRIHLDPVTEENGPLEVCAGTHLTGKAFALSQQDRHRILAEAGDVLVMRPLLAHASPRSHAQVTTHRRVIHLEFAAYAQLPDGYNWHLFSPCTGTQV
jgi:ectoine hydroxylase-related dioxygenase (phytanoyl-CoA dioxygenase family)